MVIRKLILLIMVFILGCSFVAYANLSNDEILGYINLSKSELINKLGNHYKIVPSGPEELYEGYYYSGIGITVVFDDTGKVSIIYCDKNVNIKGARAGMNFDQIQKALGRTKIHEIFNEESNSRIYQVWYFFDDNCKLIFMSDKKDGSNSTLTIGRFYRMDTTNNASNTVK